MDKVKTLKVTNIFLFLAAVGQATTGLIIFFVNEEEFAILMGNLHRYLGFLLVTLIGVHLWLNWQVIKTHYFAKRKI